MNSLQDEIEGLRRKCIGCGKCSKVCPSLKHGGCDPMEIMVGNDEEIIHCIGCGNCSKVCRRSDPYTVMRDLLCLAKGVHVSEVFKETGYAMPQVDMPARTELIPEWSGDDVQIMPGCVIKCKAPYVEYATAVAMKDIGIGCKELPGNTCCMHPIQFCEMTEFERRGYRKAMGDKAGEKTLVTLCGGCSDELLESGVDATHIVSFLHRHIDSLPRFGKPLKVAIEPGCSKSVSYDEMRAVAERMGCDVVNIKRGCCGKYADVSEGLMKDREAECQGADVIVVGCPMCLVRYDDYPGGLPVVHVSELVAMAAGDFSTLRHHKISMKMPWRVRLDLCHGKSLNIIIDC